MFEQTRDVALQHAAIEREKCEEVALNERDAPRRRCGASPARLSDGTV